MPSSGAIARVGPYTIGGEAFKNAYLEAVEAEPAATRVAAVPPDYALCLERLASIAESLQLTLPSRAQRLAKCRERYEASKDAVLEHAIPDLWVAAEARALGLAVHLPPPNELIGVRLGLESRRLAKLIARNVLAPLGSLSRPRLRSYYESHPDVYAVPAQRDLRIVRVASIGAARRIKREIANGRTFANAARGLPRQPLPSAHGFVSHYKSGEFREPVLNNAIFAAKPHTLEGPLRVSALYGYYVFEVLREYPSHQRPFASVEGKVLASLPGQLRRERLASFASAWAARWRARTRCASGFVLELCAGPRPAPGGPLSQAGSVFG